MTQRPNKQESRFQKIKIESDGGGKVSDQTRATAEKLDQKT